MRRFFLGDNALRDEILTITGGEAHHLKNVLRLKPGSRVIFFDGMGAEYEAELESLGNTVVTARVITTRQEEADRCRVTIGQGLLTGQKMDLVVQKATELGVSTIVPFVSRFCTVKEPATAKVERWQRIAREACKQCRRSREPQFRPISTWLDCLSTGGDHDVAVVFWEGESEANLHTLASQIREEPPSSLIFLVGPEGGLAEEEIAAARDRGYHVIGLGRRVLRAETASIACASLVQFLVGNLE